MFTLFRRVNQDSKDFDETSANEAFSKLCTTISRILPDLYTIKSNGATFETLFQLFLTGDYKTNLQCKNPAGSCPPCEAEHPSCIGKRDGPQAVPGRRNFFMECKDERTKRVTQCPALAPNFDPVLGTCAMVIDPCKYLLNTGNVYNTIKLTRISKGTVYVCQTFAFPFVVDPNPYCKSNPSAVVPHPNNCHQYIDCRQMNTPLGNYLQECPYPLLVSENDTNSGTPCQPFDLVQCGARMEPKSPCTYHVSLCLVLKADCQSILQDIFVEDHRLHSLLICSRVKLTRFFLCLSRRLRVLAQTLHGDRPKKVCPVQRASTQL